MTLKYVNCNSTKPLKKSIYETEYQHWRNQTLIRYRNRVKNGTWNQTATDLEHIAVDREMTSKDGSKTGEPMAYALKTAKLWEFLVMLGSALGNQVLIPISGSQSMVQELLRISKTLFIDL